MWSQGSQGITGTPEAGDQFGYSLAAANFGNSGQADLAVGVPFEDQAATNDGAVNVIYGATTGGLGAAGNEVWSQGGEGITGTPEAGDQFGYSLAAGNFGNGGQADLAVGVPFEDQAATNDGAVNVIYGATTGGLGAAGTRCGARAARASPAPLRPATSSGTAWRRATSGTAARRTWRSGCRSRTRRRPTTVRST